MPAKRARRLVVDASVAGAAGGGTATAPTATRCRDFLETLRQETRCCIVLPPKLNDEWERHMTPFASRWLKAMARRGRVIIDDVPPSNRMRREIERAAATKKTEVDALRKDFHLIEAAIAHDRIVVSRDEEVRGLFKAAAASVAAIKKVIWVNPVKPDEQPLVWLRSGAKAENVRTLGYVEPQP
ncbi:MAG TPA: hypothetical protein VFA21_00615 [Pyrinomonadaceae bacterium]|nr:hypothetical protein [Pyrinomonadaceae bacterium]